MRRRALAAGRRGGGGGGVGEGMGRLVVSGRCTGRGRAALARRGEMEGDGDGVDGRGGCAAARIFRRALVLSRRLCPLVRRGLLLGPVVQLSRLFAR
jgi:hypothetical protein